MMRRKRHKLLVLFGIVLCIMLFLYIQLNWISIAKENIYIDNLPEAFDDFKILHLSDLHSKSFGNDNEGIIKNINKMDPNIIVMTGDMRTNTSEDNGEVLITILEKLDGKYPVYYVTGEHEEGKYYNDENKYLEEGTKEAYGKRLEVFGVTVLNDEKFQIMFDHNTINIYGLKARLNGSLELEDRLGNPLIEEVNILLAHIPDYFNEYVDWRADAIFSGDTHGGIIRLPFIGGLVSSNGTFFPEYDGGVYERDNSTMIVSRGLGNYGINMRVFNRPEIIIVTLKSAID